MNRHPISLAARYAGRPLLLTPAAALELAQRIQAVDAKAFARPGRIAALLSKLAGTGRPSAMDDSDYDYEVVPFQERAAYSPLFAGEPEDIGFCWSLHDGVAMMQANTALLDRGEVFCGEVYHGYDTLLQGMREAAADSRVRATFIRMASPGGVVDGGLDALAAWMRANNGAAGGKPIWVYADMACSAAYWISSQADRILAPRPGLVGSIGAVIVHENYSGALQEAGVEITAIEFPEGKTDGAWWKSLSERAQADLQAEISQCARNFMADVTAGRPDLTAEAMTALRAAVFMASHDDAERSGLSLGLVDEISGEEDAFNALRELVSPRSSPGNGQPLAAAPGGRSASLEKPMTRKVDSNPGRAAALAKAEADLAKAKANLARVKAEGEMPPEDDKMDCEGEGEDAAAAENEAGQPAVEGEGDDAAAIAASPEAKAHPNMALSAIQSGLTLAQFKAMAATPARGQLSGALSGSPRLGGDAPAPSAVKIDTRDVYAKRKARAARG